jgi:hypothetical protein
MGRPYLCPVCHGKGTVPSSFYFDIINFGYSTTSGDYDVACKTCYGRGVIFEEEEEMNKLKIENAELKKRIEKLEKIVRSIFLPFFSSINNKGLLTSRHDLLENSRENPRDKIEEFYEKNKK